MERIAEKLSEIEKTARAIVDNAQEQNHQMEMQHFLIRSVHGEV